MSEYSDNNQMRSALYKKTLSDTEINLDSIMLQIRDCNPDSSRSRLITKPSVQALFNDYIPSPDIGYPNRTKLHHV